MDDHPLPEFTADETEALCLQQTVRMHLLPEGLLGLGECEQRPMARAAITGGGHLAAARLRTGRPRPRLKSFIRMAHVYESPEAPIARAFFPFNRCDVYACGQCGCAVLRYTEYGGYYIDPRARLVDAQWVVPDQDDTAG